MASPHDPNAPSPQAVYGSGGPRILFLFNHDAAHQAAHVAGIAGALVDPPQQGARALAGRAEVVAACGTPAIRAQVEALLPAGATDRIEWHALNLPPLTEALLTPVNAIAPVKRLARLDRYLDLFASADILVSPERTCLRVKRKLASRAPKFVFVPHGAGDRSVTYHPDMAQFDLMLVSGEKLVVEMAAHNIIPPERCRIIGYPKFDTVDLSRRQRFFANDNPVFLYNPHFDPHLSSWYDMGIAVLEAFAARPDFNLIVAPHVMLFRKKLHVSLEYRTARSRPDIPERLHDLPNIRIDLDSPRLFDMSYTLAADAYIGDVSSQVYEFLQHRGACFFLDPNGDEALEFWQNGAVCRSVPALAEQLPHWRDIAARYRPAQDRLFDYTMNVQPGRPATERGADALLDYALSLHRR